MNIFPAIDLYARKAVRLYKGDYAQMTVYSDDPVSVAKDFERAGARFIHVVDLEGARFGGTPNLPVVRRICGQTDLFLEIGGGVRDMETAETYLEAGAGRVILGTAAVTDEKFLQSAVERFGERVAVGADLADGYVAIRGWTEKSTYTADTFFEKMQAMGVSTVICTDISRDGAMRGTNRELYASLAKRYTVNLIASGGVSSMEDILALRALDLHGAIIGKAYYTGAIDLKEALEAAK